MNIPVRDLPAALKPKDYATDQEVRWCPGCGDYAVLKAVQKTLADIQADPARTVFVSGIGCAARFPYYIETYGFHTIHGRAPAIATGIKLANPELDVWVVGGDGDMLSIGGNHLIHALRRNVDLTILLFNNEIYGLTKGQFSPTSRVGTKSPSTPHGSIDGPLHGLQLAMGAGARFIARGVDTQQKELPGILARARNHKGAALVEIIQNCPVYNDDVFASFTARDVVADAQIKVGHGAPLVYGREGEKAVRFRPDGNGFEVVATSDGEPLIHDQTNRHLATLLAMLEPPMPVAIGILYDDPAPTSYETAVLAQEQAEREAAGPADLNVVMRKGATWKMPEL